MNGNIQKRYEMARSMMSHKECVVAMECLEKNLAEEDGHTLSMSLLGNILARTGKNLGKGIHLCNKAIELDRYNVVHYIRLADIYRRKNRKRMIIKVLRRGLNAMPGNKHLEKMMKRMGDRREPLISFLDRSNPLNKMAGRLAEDGRKKSGGFKRERRV